jgi:hypothetical protein
VWPVLAGFAIAILLSGLVVLVTSWMNRHDSGPAGPSSPALTPAQLRPVWTLKVGDIPGFKVEQVESTRTGAAHTSLIRLTSTSASTPFTATIGDWRCGDTFAECVKGIAPTNGPEGVNTFIPDTSGANPTYWVAGRHVEHDGLADDPYRQAWTAATENQEYQPQLIWSAGHGVIVSLTGTFGFDPQTYDYNNQTAWANMQYVMAKTTARLRDPVAMPFRLPRMANGVAPESIMLGHGLHCIGYGDGRTDPSGGWEGTVLSACRTLTGRDQAATISAAGLVTADASTIAVRNLADGTSIVIRVEKHQPTLASAADADRLARDADASPKLGDQSTWLPVK